MPADYAGYAEKEENGAFLGLAVGFELAKEGFGSGLARIGWVALLSQ